MWIQTCMIVAALQGGASDVPISMSTGFKVGEVDGDSAVVWTRRTKVETRDAAAAAGGQIQVVW